MVADPVEGLLLELLSLVPRLEAVHEREHYHHGNTTDTARLESSMLKNNHAPYPNLSPRAYRSTNDTPPYTSSIYSFFTCMSESHHTSCLGESHGLQTTRWSELEQLKQE